MMKNLKNFLLPLVATATVALFLVSCNDKTNTNTQVGSSDSIVGSKLPIAYVNIDSLMLKYQYSLDVQEKLLRKAEESQATINQHGRSLEKEMKEFQRKLENNAFFDQSRAQREQERIMKRQEDFQLLNQKLSNELAQQQMELQQALSDTIFTLLNSYNKEIGHYQMILNNAGVLVVDPSYDITEDVVKYLNSKYTPASDSQE
ncbi:MAG: OmpH family outer membrane protein [Porphyromonas sp.]|nr:OmpH family outer membrane protein [Porphyromonas sp.]